MKINEKIGLSHAIGRPRKLLRIMKVTIIIMTLFLLQVSAATKAQITLDSKGASLRNVLKSISKQSGYDFIYTDQDLNGANPVSFKLNNESIENALKACFEGQPLVYEVSDKTVMIRKKERNFLDKVIDRIMAIDVRGQVVDELGEPLAGASVKVKGSSLSTSTDTDGNFVMNNVNEEAVLEISYTGYLAKTVKAGKDVGTIRMELATSNLQEVTINKGYYSEKQQLSTGSVAKVTTNDIEQQPVNNLIGTMTGRMAGVQIRQRNGLPGASYDVQIRGLNSLRNGDQQNGNKPMYIVDGIPFSSNSLTPNLLSPFAAFSPDDIESIEVLKDADATAIYGSRGANGIVLITTKQGKAGKPSLNVNYSQGIGQVTKYLDLLNTQQYLEMRKEAFKNFNSTPSNTNAADLLLYDQNAFTDFQQLIFGKTAQMNNANASVSGGSSNSTYLINAGFARETTALNDESADQKFNTSFRLTNTSENKKLKVSFGGIFVYNSNNVPFENLNSAVFLSPNSPDVYDSAGKLNFAHSFANPVARALQRYKSNTQNFNINSALDYQFSGNLSLKTNVGYSTIRTDNIQTNPIAGQNPAGSPVGHAEFSDGKSSTWIVEPQLQYRESFKRIALDALLGGTIQGTTDSRELLRAYGYTNDIFLENIVAAPSILPGTMSYAKFRYVKMHARFNVDFDEKYVLNLTASRDGSSRFGPNNKFGNFGAMGLAWIFTKEKSLQGLSSFLSFGKLRMSYGITGSDNIPDYGYLDTYSATIAVPYDGVNSLVPARLFNPDYAWEKNKKLEVGLELGLLKERIYVTMNAYKNRSSNQLVGLPLSAVTGFSSLDYYNLPAVVQNTGFEGIVSIDIIKKTSFNWKTGLNFTIPRNKLVSYPGLENSTNANTFVVGEPITVRKLYKSIGVSPQTGIYEFEDVDNNGVIDNLDRKTLVDVGERFYGGLQNVIGYKNFELSFLVQFVKQNAAASIAFSGLPGSTTNQLNIVLDRWQKPGDVAKFQKYTRNNSVVIAALENARNSDFAYEDASFVRLKNINISYRLPTSFQKKTNLKNSRIFLQGQNLLTLTNFQGYDPETKSYAVMPTLRVVAVGVQLSF